MKRPGMPPRTSYLRRGTTPLPRVNRARKAATLERAHGSAERREWTKRQPCVVPCCGRTPCDAAHIKSGGTGRKDDVERTVPLCSDDVPTGYSGHHSEYDGGKKSFAKKYDVDMLALAADTDRRWAAHLTRTGDAA